MTTEATFTPCPAGRCEHRALSHTYDTSTRRNDGRCLSSDCTCPGVEVAA